MYSLDCFQALSAPCSFAFSNKSRKGKRGRTLAYRLYFSFSFPLFCPRFPTNTNTPFFGLYHCWTALAMYILVIPGPANWLICRQYVSIWLAMMSVSRRDGSFANNLERLAFVGLLTSSSVQAGSSPAATLE